MQEKALISTITKNNTKHFKAAPPNKLLIDLKEKETELNQLLPNLEDLQNQNKENTNAEIFQGKEGIKSILKDVLNTKKDFVVFGEECRFETLLSIFSKLFVNQLNKLKIKERVLVKEGTNPIKSKYSKFKTIPQEFTSPSSTLIYDNKVVIFIWTPPIITIKIENKEVAKSYKNYFELIWKTT